MYGRNAVYESLTARRRQFKQLLIASGTRNDARLNQIVSLARQAGCPVEEADKRVIDQFTGPANHQGVALIATPYPYARLEDIQIQKGMMLALDHLQDPQNLGTLLRAAEAAAIDGVLIPHDRAVAVTPSVVNASSGAVEHLAIAQVINLTQALEKLQKQRWWVIAVDQGPGSRPIFEAAVPFPAVLVVGSEGSGVSPRVRNQADMVVSLPMHGKVGSLNASTAGSIALYELLRRKDLERREV